MQVWATQFNGENRKKTKQNKPGTIQNKIIGRANVAQNSVVMSCKFC